MCKIHSRNASEAKLKLIVKHFIIRWVSYVGFGFVLLNLN